MHSNGLSNGISNGISNACCTHPGGSSSEAEPEVEDTVASGMRERKVGLTCKERQRHTTHLLRAINLPKYTYREANLSAYCIASKMYLECSPLANDRRDLLRTYMRTRVRDKRERAKQFDCGQEKPDTFPSHAPILADHLLRCTCDKSSILSETSAKMGSSIRRDP
jgi:hypothetical protein